jgi:hypothetical protein
MNKQEQAAFVAAYCDNVGSALEDYVADFVTRLESGEDMPYCEHYTSIVDALGMWHAGIRYQLERARNGKI